MRGNHDLCDKLEVQNPAKDERRQYEASHGSRQMLERGYTTLDQASTEPYSSKERKGLGTPANFPTRW
jgi:hypothetical protein